MNNSIEILAISQSVVEDMEGFVYDPEEDDYVENMYFDNSDSDSPAHTVKCLTHKKQVVQHIYYEHCEIGGSTQSYQCSYCKEDFQKTDDVLEHIENCQIHDNDNFTCPYCSVKFIKQVEAVNHIEKFMNE